MRILVTNDDGINATGLAVLQEIARTLSDEVWTIAPELDQSGASHSLTLREPIRMREIGERTYAVRGTPTDCVIMGTRHVLKDQRPDLVLAGVNRGSNLAEDVTYSGTVAGAIEGTLLGIRSIALSQSGSMTGLTELRWHTCASLGPPLLAKLLAADWPAGVYLSINFPDREPGEVAGTMLTRQGRRDQESLVIDERRDTWGHPYYWIGYERRPHDPPEGSDLWAITNGYISITPLHLDHTHAPSVGTFERVLRR